MLAMLTQGEMPSGPAFGLFCALAAIAMAFQTANAYRNGFMYCGRTEKAYRKDNPTRFKFWLVIQTLFVLFFVAMSVYGFLS
jgi:hypothetical protein